MIETFVQCYSRFINISRTPIKNHITHYKKKYKQLLKQFFVDVLFVQCSM